MKCFKLSHRERNVESCFVSLSVLSLSLSVSLSLCLCFSLSLTHIYTHNSFDLTHSRFWRGMHISVYSSQSVEIFFLSCFLPYFAEVYKYVLTDQLSRGHKFCLKARGKCKKKNSENCSEVSPLFVLIEPSWGE